MDPATYAQRSREVADAFVAAYPSYLSRRLDELGIDPGTVTPAIETGQRSLDDAFSGWIGLAAADQRASPLELFREALEAPTAALAEAGVPVGNRDDPQEGALPGDLYDLAPATSRDIDEDAFQAHVAWGVARAEAVAGVVPAPPSPKTAATAVLVATNLMDRTRIDEAAKGAGHQLAVWRNPAAVSDGLEATRPDVAFVDLSHGAAEEAIRRLVGAGVHTVAYGPHVDDLALAAARALGAAEVLPRSRFFARLSALFPTQV